MQAASPSPAYVRRGWAAAGREHKAVRLNQIIHKTTRTTLLERKWAVVQVTGCNQVLSVAVYSITNKDFGCCRLRHCRTLLNGRTRIQQTLSIHMENMYAPRSPTVACIKHYDAFYYTALHPYSTKLIHQYIHIMLKRISADTRVDVKVAIHEL